MAKNAKTLKNIKASKIPVQLGIPLGIGEGDDKKISIASTGVRRNRAATLERTDAYFHIKNAISPFESDNGGVSTSEAIKLCQKAFWGFSIFKNTVNVMVEFSTSNIYLRGGNKKARDFFYALLKKVGIKGIQDRFFREYYRSSNVFPYRYDSTLEQEDVIKLNQTYGAKAKRIKLPTKYIILNPCDIVADGNISFASCTYSKKLTPYEVERLKNTKNQTQEDKDFLASLPPETQKQIKEGSNMAQILVPLNPSNAFTIFNGKSDYEAMAVPVFFPVLRDIEWKEELKQIDMAVARTTQRAILLMTMGYENKDGEYCFDQNAANALRELFQNESVGSVLVADFSTKGEWLLPDIGSLLDPAKYDIVNEDIRTGLNNVLMAKDEKFANQFIQVQLFIERLHQARDVFLDEFLTPEIKRISKDLGFKNFPTPHFEDIDLKDPTEFQRIVLQLTQMGILTAEESLNALETGRIPTSEESIESQRKFKELKDEGFYEPIVGGPATQKDILKETNKQAFKIQEKQQEHDDKQSSKQRAHDKANPPPPPPPAIHINTKPGKLKEKEGRPPGTKRQKGVNRIKPAKGSEETFYLSQIKDNLILASDLSAQIKTKIQKKNKLQNLKDLSDTQASLAEHLTELIITNEDKENWIKSIDSYLDNPEDKNPDRVNDILDLSEKHKITPYLAAILFNTENKEE